MVDLPIFPRDPFSGRSCGRGREPGVPRKHIRRLSPRIPPGEVARPAPSVGKLSSPIRGTGVSSPSSSGYYGTAIALASIGPEDGILKEPTGRVEIFPEELSLVV